MTINQINNLLLDDYNQMITNRLWNQLDPQPEEVPSFTLEEMQAEFEIYKSELIAAENERLRKVDIETRFNGLSDMRAAFHNLYPNLANPAIFLRDLMNELDHLAAEATMVQIEAKDVEISTSPTKQKNDWSIALKADLAINNISTDGLLEALVRKVILNDSTLADSLTAALELINTRNPRP